MKLAGLDVYKRQAAGDATFGCGVGDFWLDGNKACSRPAIERETPYFVDFLRVLDAIGTLLVIKATTSQCTTFVTLPTLSHAVTS